MAQWMPDVGGPSDAAGGVGDHGRVPADRLTSRMVAVAVALGVAFAVLGTWVEIAGSIPGDRMLLEALHRRLGRRADRAMNVVDAATDTGPLAAAAAMTATALVVVHRWRQGLVLIAIVAAVVVVNPFLKELFARPRPTVRSIPMDVSEYSFPSGHAATSAALVAGVLLGARSTRAKVLIAVVGITFLVTVATAQVVLGAHVPSDIVAGWLWVGAWVAVAVVVARRMDRTVAESSC